MSLHALKPERWDIIDSASQPLSICGKSFRADASGALYWPSENALIVADLHLGKGASFAVRGQMLPPYDTRDTLERLADAIDRYDAATVIALGDSFHELSSISRLSDDEKAMLDVIQQEREWIWITGNHDPLQRGDLSGHVLPELCVEGLVFRHCPAETAITHEIAGHLHPAARLVMHGYSVRRPCFVSNGKRLVVPAFGTYTGGLNVLDDAYEPIFGHDGFAVLMLGHDGIYPVATRLLRGD